MFYLHFKCACRGKICPVRTKKWKFLLRISVLLFSSCMMECCDVKQRDFETLVSKKFKINSLLYPPGGGGGVSEVGKIPFFFLKLFLTPSLSDGIYWNMNILLVLIRVRCWNKDWQNTELFLCRALNETYLDLFCSRNWINIQQTW